MSSWQMKGVAAFIRVAYHRRFATEAAGRAILAKAKGRSAPPPGIRKRCVVTHRQVNGRDVYVVRARRAATGRSEHSVVYLHGGAYTSEIVKEHWALIAHLAEQTGYDVHVPIYGLAPEHHALEALDLVTTIITDLSPAGRRCYLAGDSAGGGLALLAAQAFAGDPAPVAGLTIIAPWLDLTMANPAIPAVERTDPWLTRAGLHPIAAAWAGDVPLTDPRLSPLYGNLAALPPLQLLVGTRDITLPDCRVLRDRIIPSGTPLDYHEEPGAIHVYPLLPVPEARPAREAIVNHIRRTLA
jgi:acetyl esterase/lipase